MKLRKNVQTDFVERESPQQFRSHTLFRKFLSIVSAILVVASVIVFIFTVRLFGDGRNFSNLQGYMKLQFSPDISMDNQTMTELDQACQRFYDLTYKNSILFEVSDELKYACMTSTLDQILPEQRYVYLNNGYLTMNPIYDSDGKAITVDEDTCQLTILAPQGGTLTDEELIEHFQAMATMKYYYTEGAKIESADGFPLLPTKIIRYSAGQTFFLCSESYRNKIGMSIDDAIAFVVTKGNTSPYMHSHYQTSGAYLVDESVLTPALPESGISDYILNLVSPYSLFQKKMLCYLLTGFMLLSSSILCIIVLIHRH